MQWHLWQDPAKGEIDPNPLGRFPFGPRATNNSFLSFRSFFAIVKCNTVCVSLSELTPSQLMYYSVAVARRAGGVVQVFNG